MVGEWFESKPWEFLLLMGKCEVVVVQWKNRGIKLRDFWDKRVGRKV